MADEKPPETLTGDELRIIVDGTEKRLEILDRHGVKHTLLPLTMRDIIDFENEIGTSILAIMNANLSMRHVLYLAYCSLRKEGMSQEDIKKRKYKYSEADVQDMFDLQFLNKSVSLFTKLLLMSGFGQEKKKEEIPGNPPVSPASANGVS